MANTFQDFWEILVRRTPELRDDSTSMKITVESFRKSMQRAYQMGGVHSLAVAKELDRNGFDKLINDILGGGL